MEQGARSRGKSLKGEKGKRKYSIGANRDFGEEIKKRRKV